MKQIAKSLALAFVTGIFFFSNAIVANKSGIISSNEIWNDTIFVNGDVIITKGNVSVKSGSVIIFRAGSNVNVQDANATIEFAGTEFKPIIIKGGVNKKISAYGQIIMRFCRIDSCKIIAGSGTSKSHCMIMEDNIITNGNVSCYWRPGIIRRNFIQDPTANNQIVLDVDSVKGFIVTDNIITGGTWVTGQLGGIIRGNVFISLFVPAGSSVEKNTHEHMFGVSKGAIIERNIFIGKSYGAIMGIGKANASNSLIRNNTFDLRGSGDCIVFHHTDPKPYGVTVRNNIFIRSTAMNDEEKTPNSIIYTDYNLFVSVKNRYQNVNITGKNINCNGFDMYSLPQNGKTLLPTDVVVNPDSGYPFPYSNKDMLSGAKTFQQSLDYYRKIYSLKNSSPAINAGAPQDSFDSLVIDKQCDIGAIEYRDSGATKIRKEPLNGYKLMFPAKSNTGNIKLNYYDVIGRNLLVSSILFSNVNNDNQRINSIKRLPSGSYISQMEQQHQQYIHKLAVIR